MSNAIIVELHVPDFEKAIAFYALLGFAIARRDERYLVLERKGNILCFNDGSAAVYEQSYFRKFPRQTKRGYGVEIVIPVENVRALYDSVKESVNVVAPLEKKFWGLWDFRVEDPFGFYLRITEAPDWRKPQHG